MPFVREGVHYYLKRLKSLAEVDIVEVKGIGGKALEGFLQKVPITGSYVVLDPEGQVFNSEEFAGLIDTAVRWDFVLGGAYGVPPEVRQRARMLLSLSPITMPHELVRVVFLEQLYRAMSIINKTGYHH